MKITIPPGAVRLDSGAVVTEAYVVELIRDLACDNAPPNGRCWSCWTCDLREAWIRALHERFPLQLSLALQEAA